LRSPPVGGISEEGAVESVAARLATARLGTLGVEVQEGSRTTKGGGITDTWNH
jgi:hypothetical protein